MTRWLSCTVHDWSFVWCHCHLLSFSQWLISGIRFNNQTCTLDLCFVLGTTLPLPLLIPHTYTTPTLPPLHSHKVGALGTPVWLVLCPHLHCLLPQLSTKWIFKPTECKYDTILCVESAGVCVCVGGSTISMLALCDAASHGVFIRNVVRVVRE